MNNKYFIILCFSFLFTGLLFAQSEEKNYYMFDEFQKGKAVYKNGTIANGIFNYDLITGKILFMEDDVVMEMINLPLFAYVEMSGRTFLCIKNEEFYEKIKLSGIDLYVKWKSTLISQGKNTGYGSKTQSSAVTQVNQMRSAGRMHKIDVDEGFSLSPRNGYYLNLNGKYKSFNNLNSLSKLFKEHKDEISQTLKSEKIDFEDIEDVKKAVQYCSQFLNQ